MRAWGSSMSETERNQIDAALAEMSRAGQAMVRSFMDMVSAVIGAGPTAEGAGLPLPDAETLTRLQRELSERHAALWAAMLTRKPGEAGEAIVSSEPGDRRFNAPAWAESPIYDYIRQAYLLNARFLQQVAEALPLTDDKMRARVSLLTRHYLDAMSPANFAATNPEFVQTALETNGESITRGIRNLLGDLEKGRISLSDDAAFEVGRNLAVTPGAVVYENALMQLIQYAPTTTHVASRPLLIVPPCINKYYVLDLGPDNSLVRFIVAQGFTVYLISWKNAGPAEAQFGWDDYVAQGPFAALEVVRKITRVRKPSVLGFCVGGTLLASALAIAREKGAGEVASVTLMTTLLDFSEAGELGCLVDDASLAAREAAIGAGGLMKGQELANVFSSLRANDLIWQYVVGNYLKGKSPPAFDLLYWNADSADLPGPFLTWYLRNMYLENNLCVPGKLKILGADVDLGAIKAPAYIFATAEDHIVPWRGAYASRRLLGGETTFVLGASGHIAGAINPASRNRRSYRVADADSQDPEQWLAGSEEHKGSWWLHWIEWLARHSGKKVPAPTALGSAAYVPIEAAPGRYVTEKV